MIIIAFLNKESKRLRRVFRLHFSRRLLASMPRRLERCHADTYNVSQLIFRMLIVI